MKLIPSSEWSEGDKDPVRQTGFEQTNSSVQRYHLLKPDGLGDFALLRADRRELELQVLSSPSDCLRNRQF